MFNGLCKLVLSFNIEILPCMFKILIIFILYFRVVISRFYPLACKDTKKLV